ncbi:MAG: hypothetical protein NTZ24_12115, partial [Deltaproteobacteria bacterium]|nr:hypothetical protein [Deltaproteobacteria bacterium]
MQSKPVPASRGAEEFFLKQKGPACGCLKHDERWHDGMTHLKILLRNRNGIFLLALAAGLALPGAAPVTRHLVLPALALAMTLSTMEIGNEVFVKPRTLLFPALLGIIMSYIILGNIIIGLSALLIRDEALWTGFVLLAAAPPAVAVI